MSTIGGGGYNYPYRLNTDGTGQFLDKGTAYDSNGKLTDKGMSDIFRFTSNEMDQFSGGDGFLDQRELSNLIGTPPDKIENIFKVADTDGNGRIDQGELAHLHLKQDKNHDGMITEDEKKDFGKMADFFSAFKIKPKKEETEEVQQMNERFNAFRNPPPGMAPPS